MLLPLVLPPVVGGLALLYTFGSRGLLGGTLDGLGVQVAFSTVAVVMDVIGKVGGVPNFSKYKPGGIHIGVWITAVISFLIIAAVVYFFIVTPYNKLQSRMARGKEPAPPAPDIALLTEIRDLLANRPGGTTVEGGGGLT